MIDVSDSDTLNAMRQLVERLAGNVTRAQQWAAMSEEERRASGYDSEDDFAAAKDDETLLSMADGFEGYIDWAKAIVSHSRGGGA